MKKGGDEKKPAPVSKTAFKAEMFVMPEEYRHGKVVAVVEPKKPQPVQTTPPPAPKPAQKKPIPPKKGMSKGMKAFIVADVIIILGIGIAGYLYLRSQPVPTPVVTETPIVAPPPRVPDEPSEPIIEEPPVEAEDPFEEIIPGVDSDSDGLTDVEEQIIYGTNPSLPDTDSDGFLDGNEVFHRYNPGGTAPGTLLGSGLVKEHLTDFFSIYYPATWTTGVVPQTDTEGFVANASFVNEAGEVVPSYASTSAFAAPTGEKIMMSVSAAGAQANQLEQSWREEFASSALLSTTSKTGLRVLLTEDKLNALIVLDGRVLLFTYEPGLKTTVDYQQTFQMMFNSIALLVDEEV